jgi:CDP-L-myo-inositol myo-inositolphosphotransferase
MPMLGMSLIERVLCACAKAGVERFVVVGCDSEEVRAHVEDISARRKLLVTCVAADWASGTGAAALVGANELGADRFLLLGANAIIEPSLLERLASDPPAPDEVCVAAVRGTQAALDRESVPKVAISDGSVETSGEDLAAWGTIGPGVLFCTPVLQEALEQCRFERRHGLGHAIRELARHRRVRAVEVPGSDFLVVDTPRAYREAKRRLLETIGKGGEDGLVASWLNRPLSTRLSAVLVRTRATPDLITVVSFLLGLVGAGLFALGGYAAALAGGLMAQAASVVDGCDGEVARLRQATTPRGAWLDTVLDRYADMALVVAITFAYASRHPSALPWLGGMITASGFVLASYVTKEYSLRHGRSYPHDLLDRIKRRDLRILAICLGAVAGVPFAAMLAMGLLSHVAVVAIMVRGWRRSSERTGQPSATVLDSTNATPSSAPPRPDVPRRWWRLGIPVRNGTP